ncbi:POT family domain-containing protein [Ditylenchus destructor]|nr:POT family domain-containing protein [Ditylenchus destructor]
MPVAQVHIDPRNGNGGAQNSINKNHTKPDGSSTTVQWPFISTGCVFIFEFLERFAYYIIQTILLLYLTNVMQLDAGFAMILFQSMALLSYSMPIIGALVADVYVGRVNVIFWGSIVLLFGYAAFAMAPMLPIIAISRPYLDLGALFVIASSSGAIKACIASGGANQFAPPNTPGGSAIYPQFIACFFAILYFMSNAAGLSAAIFAQKILGTFVESHPRKSINSATPCLGLDMCFPGALSAPAITMIVATLLLATSKCLYRQVGTPPFNIVSMTIHVIHRAIINWMQSRRNRKNKVPWKDRDVFLDHAMDDHDCTVDELCRHMPAGVCVKGAFVEAVKSVFKIILILLPVPIFWAIMDFQEPLWEQQALYLKTQVTEQFALEPPIMKVTAVIIMLFLIPAFQLLIYPCISMTNCCTVTYLKRIAAGGLIAAFAFGNSAILQCFINMTVPPKSPSNAALFTVFNDFPSTCDIAVTEPTTGYANTFSGQNVMTGNPTDIMSIPVSDTTVGARIQPTLNFSGECLRHKMVRYKTEVQGGMWSMIIATPQGIFSYLSTLTKPPAGSSVSIIMAVPCSAVDSTTLPSENCSNLNTDIQKALSPFVSQLVLCDVIPGQDGCVFSDTSMNNVWMSNETSSAPTLFSFPPTGDNMGQASVSLYAEKNIAPGEYKLFTTSDNPPTSNSTFVPISVNPSDLIVSGAGGVYLLTVTTNGSVLSINKSEQSNSSVSPFPAQTVVKSYTLAIPNFFSILWQFPQYILIAAAEILVAITGMEFCFIEAPDALKAVVLAFWFFTIAVGKLLTLPLTYAMQIFAPLLIHQLSACSIGMLFFTVSFAYLSVFHYNYCNFKIIRPLPPENNKTESLVSNTEEVPKISLMDELEFLRMATLRRLPQQFVTRL